MNVKLDVSFQKRLQLDKCDEIWPKGNRHCCRARRRADLCSTKHFLLCLISKYVVCYGRDALSADIKFQEIAGIARLFNERAGPFPADEQRC